MRMLKTQNSTIGSGTMVKVRLQSTGVYVEHKNATDFTIDKEHGFLYLKTPDDNLKIAYAPHTWMAVERG
jgi:hypothetical protein